MMAACLAHAGEEVTLVVRPNVRQESVGDLPPQIQLESPFGSWSGNVNWSETVPPTDVLWITLKATQLQAALHSIADTKAIGAVVPLLNGLDHLEVLRAKFGRNQFRADRVIPATIAGEMERVGVGHFVHRSPFAVLNISGRGRSLLQGVTGQLRKIGFTCNFIDDETTLMWSKLVFLGPFALATTAFDKPIGDVVANPETWQQLEQCVRETCAAGIAESAKVDAEKVLPAIRKAPAAMRSSMQKDVDHGREPELDAIGGAIVRAAARHGLKVPATEELIARIRQRIG